MAGHGGPGLQANGNGTRRTAEAAAVRFSIEALGQRVVLEGKAERE
jgi:hypothetical protein